MIRRFLKQLFCWHHWSVNICTFFSGGTVHYKECDKCGKIVTFRKEYR